MSDPPAMRVAILGNLANVGAQLTDYLSRSGVECELLAAPKELKIIEPELQERISARPLTHPVPGLVWAAVCGLLPRGITKYLSSYYRYDCIISMASYNRLPWIIRVPFVAIATGSDLREESYKPRASILYRWGFRRSRIVLSWMFDSRALAKVEMFGLSQFRFLRFPIDTERYRPAPSTIPERAQHDFIVYSPTRQDWGYEESGERWLGALKGNDKLVRGFARFLRSDKGTIRNPLLILMNTGTDVEQTRQLVRTLGIEEHVTFREFLSIDERISLINASDVVADHFCAGSFGGTFVEVLSCGKPLLHYLETDNIDLAYPERPPMLNASTEEEICAQLLACQDRQALEALGASARAWILRHHRWESVTATLIHYLRLIHGRPDVCDIQDDRT